MTAIRATASTPQWRAYWRPLASLAAIGDEWRVLAARALQPNVFYEPDFALPAAAVFGESAGAVLVRGDDGTLRGLFPTRHDHYRYPVLPGAAAGWTHPYAPLGTPLIDRDCAPDVLNAWLAHLSGEQGLRFLLLPLLPDDGAVAAALRDCLRERGLPQAAFGSHRRAMLAPGQGREDYVVHAVNAKMRKELARKQRRLSDLGEVAHDAATDPLAVRAALQDFLALEEKGWKGRAGTATAQDTALRHFMESVVVGLARRGQARADSLSVSGQPVAITVLLRSGACAWLWKIAYDEAFARLSPGMQLTRDITAALLRDETLAATDSCATADHPMIDHLWRERLALSDLLISLRPNDHSAFKVACSLEALRRNARNAARFIRDKVVRPARAADGG
jgi:CelD/BcsL family acetyltransferase involved in cellulose biosynthesis